MENKNVGWMLLGISFIIIIIILLFNSTMRSFVNETCSLEHGLSCPMYSAISRQTYLAFSIVGILIIVGIVLLFTKPQKEIIIKKVKEKTPKKKIDTTELRPEEKQILKLIQKNKAIFQADLIEKTGFTKARITRIIDKLEGKDFVERKRRGLTNIVVMKE